MRLKYRYNQLVTRISWPVVTFFSIIIGCILIALIFANVSGDNDDDVTKPPVILSPSPTISPTVPRPSTSPSTSPSPTPSPEVTPRQPSLAPTPAPPAKPSSGALSWFSDGTLRVWNSQTGKFEPVGPAFGLNGLCRSSLGSGQTGYFTRFGNNPANCARGALVFVGMPALGPGYWLDVGVDYVGVRYWQRYNVSSGEIDAFSGLPELFGEPQQGWFHISGPNPTQEADFFTNGVYQMAPRWQQEIVTMGHSPSYPYGLDLRPSLELGRRLLEYDPANPTNPAAWYNIMDPNVTPECSKVYDPKLCH
jgi:hypothetical protein